VKAIATKVGYANSNVTIGTYRIFN